jgi:hypothetical protein
LIETLTPEPLRSRKALPDTPTTIDPPLTRERLPRPPTTPAAAQ